LIAKGPRVAQQEGGESPFDPIAGARPAGRQAIGD
jgi:hypothetical protein